MFEEFTNIMRILYNYCIQNNNKSEINGINPIIIMKLSNHPDNNSTQEIIIFL
jgi:hypothetical protein